MITQKRKALEKYAALAAKREQLTVLMEELALKILGKSDNGIIKETNPHKHYRHTDGPSMRDVIRTKFKEKSRWTTQELIKALPHFHQGSMHAMLGQLARNGELRRLEKGSYEAKKLG